MGTSLPATEAVAERYRDLDAWPAAAALDALWEAELSAVASVRAALPAIAAAVTASVARLRSGGRLVFAGAGTSGRLGAQEAAELPPTFGWPPERLALLLAGGARALAGAVENAEDDIPAAQAAVDAQAISNRDVFIGIAASGRTPFTLAALQRARQQGAIAIAIANSAASPLLDAAEFPILAATGAEPIAGSTRLKAGTAQKVILNLFSTQVMIGLGHVHEGLMVDMRASNEKLRDRAVRMLRKITGCDDAAARRALAATGGNVKSAVLVCHGIDAPGAAALLERHEGHLRPALRELQP